MIGIDTNILLRFVLQDHPEQFNAAKAFLEKRSLVDPAFVSLFVFAETCWVLSRRYGLSNAVIAETFLKLIVAEELFFEDEDFLDILLGRDLSNGVDISDHVIAYLSSRAGCGKTVTFDRDAARKIPGMELLK